MANQQLSEELLKPFFRKLEKRKVNSYIGDADHVDIHLISKYNQGIAFVLCAIDI